MLKPHIHNITPADSDVLCGKRCSSMVLRTTKRGANVGKRFYGCTNCQLFLNIKNVEQN